MSRTSLSVLGCLVALTLPASLLGTQVCASQESLAQIGGREVSAPFFHHGLFTTLRRSVLAHDGEARDSRRAFEALPAAARDALIEFLKTLQVLPPGTKDRIVDEQFKARSWPPSAETLTHSSLERRP